MMRFFFFVILYVIAVLLGFERRGRYDEWMMRKPHMQARLHIFAQECVLYNQDSVPDEERDELLPPSTIDALAWNSALAMRAVEERQAELDRQLAGLGSEPSGDSGSPDAVAVDPVDPGSGDRGVLEEGVPVDEEHADATTSFHVPDAASVEALPPEDPYAGEPVPSADSAPLPDAPVDLSGYPAAEAEAVAGSDPAALAGDLALEDVAGAPGADADDPALSVLAELGDDLPVDGDDPDYGGPVDEPSAEPPSEPPALPVRPSAAAPEPARGGGAYAGLVAAVASQQGADTAGEGGDPARGPSDGSSALVDVVLDETGAVVSGDAVDVGDASDPAGGSGDPAGESGDLMEGPSDSVPDLAYASLPPGVGAPRQDQPPEPAPEAVSASADEHGGAVTDAVGDPEPVDVSPAPSAPVPRRAGAPAPSSASARLLARQRAAQRADEERAAAEVVGEADENLANLGPGVSFTPARSRRGPAPGGG